MYCRMKEKVATDCLVICVAISKYTKKSQIPNCDNVVHDITTYTNTFKQNANYTVLSNDPSQMYTKQTLIQYFTQCFTKELYDPSTGAINYNCLIITVSGHCTDNSVICSNGETLHFTEILSVFTGKWKNKSLIVNLPKFLIVDGQRGFNYLSEPLFNDDRKDDIAYIEAQMMDDDITDTYSVIMCSVSSSPNSQAYGGQLCWNLCALFSQNMKWKRDIIFYDIIKQLKQRLNTALLDNYQFSFDFIEHDMDIDDVVFTMPQLRARARTEFKRGQSLSLLTLKQRRKEKKDKKENGKSSKGLLRKRGKTQVYKPRQLIVQDAHIVTDPLFKDTIEWEKSIQIVNKTKDKTRVKVQWLFVLNNESHNVCLLHSQKRDPYIKAKRVLFIDGKQIWTQKSTVNEFIETFDDNVVTVSIVYDHEKVAYNYHLKLNNRSHKQHFQKWFANVLSKTFVE
eukprot:272354_1